MTKRTPDGHFVLHVTSSTRLRATSKRVIKDAARTLGLVHPGWHGARQAAVALSRLPAVRHVAVEQVIGHGIYVGGRRAKP